jgi:hypothetical protein
MSGGINVLSRTQIINVEPTSGSVSVINAGPAGPGGGDSFWEEVAGVLQPTNDPHSVLIEVTNGATSPEAGGITIKLPSGQYVGIYFTKYPSGFSDTSIGLYSDESPGAGDALLTFTVQSDPSGNAVSRIAGVSQNGLVLQAVNNAGGTKCALKLGTGSIGGAAPISSPVSFDVMPSEPHNDTLGTDQATFYSVVVGSDVSLRVKHKDVSGVVRHYTIGTMT